MTQQRVAALVLITVIHDGLAREVASIELSQRDLDAVQKHRDTPGVALAEWVRNCVYVDLEAVHGYEQARPADG